MKQHIYNGKRILKNVSFGKADMDLLNYAEGKKDFSAYIKQLIKSDMEKDTGKEFDSSTIEKQLSSIIEMLKEFNTKKGELATTIETAEEEDNMESAKAVANSIASMFNIKR